MIGSGVLVADPSIPDPAALSWYLCRVLLVLWFSAGLHEFSSGQLGEPAYQ